MRRLAMDARLRESLGQNARRLWRERFTLERMVSGYRAAIEAALAAPLPRAVLRAEWPAHLLRNGTEFATTLMSQMDLPESRISRIWSSDSR
jgi:hypothetical protein